MNKSNASKTKWSRKVLILLLLLYNGPLFWGIGNLSVLVVYMIRHMHAYCLCTKIYISLLSYPPPDAILLVSSCLFPSHLLFLFLTILCIIFLVFSVMLRNQHQPKFIVNCDHSKYLRLLSSAYIFVTLPGLGKWKIVLF